MEKIQVFLTGISSSTPFSDSVSCAIVVVSRSDQYAGTWSGKKGSGQILGKTVCNRQRFDSSQAGTSKSRKNDLAKTIVGNDLPKKNRLFGRGVSSP